MLLGGALAGAFSQLRRLDALETQQSFDGLGAGDWRAREGGARVIPLGSTWRLPEQGLLRVRACGVTAAPTGSLEVSEGGGRVVARVAFAHEHGLPPRCAVAKWPTPRARNVSIAMASRGAGEPLPTVMVRTGRAIDPGDLWPALLAIAGFSLLVLGPRIVWGRRVPRVAELPGVDTSPPAMRGLEGAAFCVGAFVAAQAVAQVPVLAWGLRGSTFLMSQVLQQGAFMVMAAGMLGAFTSPSARRAMELEMPERGWLWRAAVCACGLLGVALAVGAMLNDASESPMAKALESMPSRYVIAFGAVCAPLPEELFFRAVLGRVTASVVGERRGWMVVAGSALVFTVAHAMQLQGARLGLIPIAAVGIVNGWLRWRTKGIVAPWAVHTMYNGVLSLSALA